MGYPKATTKLATTEFVVASLLMAVCNGNTGAMRSTLITINFDYLDGLMDLNVLVKDCSISLSHKPALCSTADK